MRRETAQGEDYLGLKIFRFYFRCPNCLAELVFKTDIENVDYQMEHGATRLFEAAKYYQQKQKEAEELEEAEKNDPMKVLEKRTEASRAEMEAVHKLGELQEMNRRNNKVDLISFLDSQQMDVQLTQAQRHKLQEEEDEKEVQRLMAKKKVEVKEETEEVAEEEQKPSSSKIQWKAPAKRNAPNLLAGFIKKKAKVKEEVKPKSEVLSSSITSDTPSSSNGLLAPRTSASTSIAQIGSSLPIEMPEEPGCSTSTSILVDKAGGTTGKPVSNRAAVLGALVGNYGSSSEDEE
ncbi:unnamed protein product [Bursaphelenchus okinawaensis]|nr:unnamed protein product [Bursaphelenchus okinawaensis]CAG9098068.1 unnamed protein product [Bursaphelenchus okinawaensis]